MEVFLEAKASQVNEQSLAVDELDLFNFFFPNKKPRMREVIDLSAELSRINFESNFFIEYIYIFILKLEHNILILKFNVIYDMDIYIYF